MITPCWQEGLRYRKATPASLRTTLQLQTTRSWDFIGLNDTAQRNATFESDVIISTIDSGVWPESESFNDDGFAPPPKKWRGVCKGGKNFTCNNKVIGARIYEVIDTARDELGHGTHTASTAAGNAVKGTSFYGIAQGTASGAVPAARIAVYKVCDKGCYGDVILAAFDDAIADGVDIITISQADIYVQPFEKDVIAIGGFHTAAKGILTAQSAGNFGPSPGATTSVAPWLLSVAASSTDRRIVTNVLLGDGTKVGGLSVNSFVQNGTGFPLIHGNEATLKNCSLPMESRCDSECLDSDLVKGKIVLCENLNNPFKVTYEAGALGAIFDANWLNCPLIQPHPVATMQDHQYDVIKSYYMKSREDARATILKSDAEHDETAPVIAQFSARGPNLNLPEIIKPDISAPGISILAAFPPVAKVTFNPEDTRRVKYNIMSGTTMSCPHAAGAAAYVKSFHPDWSAAAIKSSLMITAWPMNVTDDSPGEFAYGWGHINPIRAINPGLVYDASREDYIKLLCSVMGEDTLRLISGDNSTCPAHKDSPKDHNYPSFAAVVPVEEPFIVQFRRVVKNVGTANSTYYSASSISGNKTQLDIKVAPEVLSFKSLYQEKSFVLTVSGPGLSNDSQPHVSASLVWSTSDGT